MKQCSTVAIIQHELQAVKKKGLSVGFVPTMGALHAGHLQLIETAQNENKCVVVSIFVNPTQFNDKQDFDNYPRTLEADIDLLNTKKVDFLFIPDTSEIYTDLHAVHSPIDLGNIDTVMEGEYRPGHFQGVVQIVRRLFDIIAPDRAYFGEKDFQQLSIIRRMTQQLKLPVNIIACPTVRNSSGLALSSRNARLTSQQLQQATVLYQTLLFAKQAKNSFSPDELKQVCLHRIQDVGMEVEYFDIVHAHSLLPLTNTWETKTTAVACVAAYCGTVRLIDNMQLN